MLGSSHDRTGAAQVAPVWRLADRPVSVAEYRLFATATGRKWREQPSGWIDEHPAVFVSLRDAEAYCGWMTERGTPCRLPTDEEWLAAAEAGDWRISADCADPAVSVWEWTATPWVTEHTDGPRVLRGGSWIDLQDFARAASRGFNLPGNRGYAVGFRVVLGPSISGEALASDDARSAGGVGAALEAVARAAARYRTLHGDTQYCDGCGCAMWHKRVVHAHDCVASELDVALTRLAEEEASKGG